MAKFVHKPSGLIVEVGEGVSLPDFAYEPVTEKKTVEAEKPKTARTRKTAKTAKQ